MITRRWWAGWGCLLVGAASLQALWLPLRWNPITLAYGAYVSEWRFMVEQGPWHGALTTWQGLHPPLHALLLALLLALGTGPWVWHGVSGLFSVAAVGFAALAPGARAPRSQTMARVGLFAGALLAVSPHRNAYGLEINNYPLAMAATAAQWWAWSRFLASTERPPGHRDAGQLPWKLVTGSLALAAATAIATWSHAFALALPAAQGLTLAWRRDARRARPWGLAMAVAGAACLPLLPGALHGGDPINTEPSLARALAALLWELPGRYGLAAASWATVALMVGGAARALRRKDALGTSLAVHSVLGGAGLLVLMATGTASAEQHQYWTLLLPGASVLAALGLRPLAVVERRHRFDERGVAVWLPPPARAQALAAVVLAVAVGQGLDQARQWAAARAARSNAARTHPVSARTLAEWREGALVLVGIPSFGDDDKDGVDTVWGLVPPVVMDFDDPRVEGMTPFDPHWGQPVRLADGRWLYTFTSVLPDRLQAIAEHHDDREQPLAVVGYGLRSDPEGHAELLAWARRWGPVQATGDEVGVRVR